MKFSHEGKPKRGLRAAAVALVLSSPFINTSCSAPEAKPQIQESITPTQLYAAESQEIDDICDLKPIYFLNAIAKVKVGKRQFYVDNPIIDKLANGAESIGYQGVGNKVSCTDVILIPGSSNISFMVNPLSSPFVPIPPTANKVTFPADYIGDSIPGNALDPKNQSYYLNIDGTNMPIGLESSSLLGMVPSEVV